MAPFKVIIVGGSVAGMGLANMLEQCDIDFVLLEKHEIIAPDLGACLGLMANGLRVMEQLGCYDELHKISMSLNALDTYDGDGKPLILLKNLGHWLVNLTGYKNENQDRRQVIDVLFQNLRDKSKIHTSKGVVKIESFSDHVKVETVDGSVYQGDIVVGADGVHSRVLDEMQRLSEIDVPNSRLFTRDEFDCNYRGLICIGTTPKGLALDNGIKVNKKGRSYMSVSGQNGRFYFNLFEKVERTTGSSIPRYAKDECDGVAAKYANDIVVPKAATGGDRHVTLGDLYKDKQNAMLVSIHEGILKQCFYKRIILVGDSFHKSTPLLGQGGNNCLASAAYLANQLNAITRGDQKPDEAQIAKAFQKYKEVRTPENSQIVSSGKQMQKMDAFEDRIVEAIARYGLPCLSNHQLWNGMLPPNSSMWLLDYLPLPKSRGSMTLSREEISIDARERSTVANIIWVFLFLTPVLLLYGYRPEGVREGPLRLDWYDLPFGFKIRHNKVEDFYFNIVVSSIISLMSVEASRASAGFTLLGSGLLHASLALFLGWPIQLALYSIAFLRVTGARNFYYPSVRVIHPATLILLAQALVIAYAPALYYTFYSGDAFPSELWRRSHSFLPIALFLLKGASDRSWMARWIPSNPTIDVYLKETHVKYLSLLSSFLFVPQFLSSRLVGTFLSRVMLVLQSDQADTISRTTLEITCLEIGALVFLIFAWWDLRRVSGNSRSVLGDLLLGVPLVLLASPTTALMLFWGTREVEWSKSYKQKPVERTKSGV